MALEIDALILESADYDPATGTANASGNRSEFLSSAGYTITLMDAGQYLVEHKASRRAVVFPAHRVRRAVIV